MLISTMLMLGFFFFSSVPLIIEQAVHGLQQIIRLSVCARLARQLTRGILGHSGYQVPYSPWQASSMTPRDTMLILVYDMYKDIFSILLV